MAIKLFLVVLLAAFLPTAAGIKCYECTYATVPGVEGNNAACKDVAQNPTSTPSSSITSNQDCDSCYISTGEKDGDKVIARGCSENLFVATCSEPGKTVEVEADGVKVAVSCCDSGDYCNTAAHPMGSYVFMTFISFLALLFL